MTGLGGEAGGVVLAWGTATDTGNVRGLNEDALLAELPMFVVADGMGGHEAGELASALTVELFRRVATGGLASVEKVAKALSVLNQEIHDHGSGSGAGMGTTAVGLVLVDNGGMPSWLVFNVGDSRAYCFAHDGLAQLSVDHSYVQELVQLGELSPDDARHHPNRNVITKALGAAPDVDPDYWLRTVEPRERFLLCSDGLTSEVDDDRIREILARGDDADTTAGALVEEALRNGGRDNVTVVVIDVSEVSVRDATSETHPRLKAVGRAPRPPVITTVPGVGSVRSTEESSSSVLITMVPDNGESRAPEADTGAVSGESTNPKREWPGSEGGTPPVIDRVPAGLTDQADDDAEERG